MEDTFEEAQKDLADIIQRAKAPSIRDRMFHHLREDFLEVEKDLSLAPLLRERIVFALELGLLSPAEHEELLKKVEGLK